MNSNMTLVRLYFLMRRLAATGRSLRESHALVEQISGTGVREDDEAGLPRALHQHRAAPRDQRGRTLSKIGPNTRPARAFPGWTRALSYRYTARSPILKVILPSITSFLKLSMTYYSDRGVHVHRCDLPVLTPYSRCTRPIWSWEREMPRCEGSSTPCPAYS